MDMIEKVARAIYDQQVALNVLDFCACTGFETEDAHIQSIFRAQARAAIEAMRKPTPEMIQAAHTSWFDGWPGRHTSPSTVAPSFVETWQAQIDAALTTRD